MNHQANLANIKVGGSQPVRIMGVINLSPESFFKQSIHVNVKTLIQHTKKITSEGADFIDIGAMSTAPYLKTAIDEQEEAKRLAWAIPIVRDHSPCPISVDTSRAKPAELALQKGAKILNDVHGLVSGELSYKILKDFSGVILMAHPDRLGHPSHTPWKNIARVFQSIMKHTRALKIPAHKIVLDPGIGFFRFPHIPWWQWDINVLHHLTALQKLGRPLMVGVSRKSFLGHILGGKPPKERLPASLAATVFAVLKGAAIIRTHDVKETKEAASVGQWLKEKS